MFRRKRNKKEEESQEQIPTKRVADSWGRISTIKIESFWSYQPGDVILRFDDRSVVAGRTIGKLWYKEHAGHYLYYGKIQRDNIQLLERPGFKYQDHSWPKRKFKVGDRIEGKISGQTVRGQVVVMNPEENPLYLIECENFISGENGDYGNAQLWGKEWYPKQYKTDSQSRIWLKLKDEENWRLVREVPKKKTKESEKLNKKSPKAKETKDPKGTEEKIVKPRSIPKRSVLATAQERGIKIPDWAEQFLRKERAGIAQMFILHFNINDYVEAGEKYLSLLDYLRMLFSQRDFVLSYNISSGIEFLKGEEKEFKELVAFKQQASGALARVTGTKGPQGLPKDTNQVLSLLERLLQKKRHKDKDIRSAVIVEYPESIVPADNGGSPSLEDRTNVVTFLRWAKDSRIAENGNLIILLAGNLMDLHASLRAQDAGIETICIEKPKPEGRFRYIKWLRSDSEGYEKELEGADLRQLAHTTAGLNCKQIEDVFLQAREAGEKISFKFVKERKRKILEQEYGELLEIIEPEYGMEAIGGLKKQKQAMGKIVTALEGGNCRRVPMGTLYVGPPGTGKTVMAIASAKEAGFNFVKLGSIMDKFVGETEKRWHKASLGIKSLIPVIVVVDEIDQALGQRDENSNDGGVGRRLFGNILELISDTTLRGKVFWIGITNRPDLIDAAMKRPGRFDLKIPFPFPTLEEKKDIFTAVMRKNHWQHSIKDFTPFIESPFYNIEGEEVKINGSDIEGMVVNSFAFADDEGREKISEKDLWKAVKDYIPTYDKDEIAHMTHIAYKECSSKSLLPDDWKQVLGVEEKKEEVSESPSTTSFQRKVKA